VHFLYLTRGGAYDPVHVPCARAEATRTAEAAAACAALGVTGHAFADQADGALVADASTLRIVLDRLAPWRPDLLIGHHPVDRHPDHQAAGCLAIRAREQLGCALWFLEGVPGGQTHALMPDRIVDISSCSERKYAALALHASQDPGGSLSAQVRRDDRANGVRREYAAAEWFSVW
jgi:LmbE family N-acetylglucosaminyl deacetylase